MVLIRKTKFLTDRVAEAALNAALAALLAVAIGIGVSLQLQRSVMRPWHCWPAPWTRFACATITPAAPP